MPSGGAPDTTPETGVLPGTPGIPLEPLDLRLPGLAQNHDVVIVCRAACGLLARVDDPSPGVFERLPRGEAEQELPFVSVPSGAKIW